MNYPIPTGTRDILPDEMRELRQLSSALLETFQRFGYGEVSTPTMEYEDVLVQGDERAAGASYRLFDEHGQVLALRSDMTIPIARLAATRFADAEPPLRFCYLSHAYRAVRPQRGQQREFLQAGIELIGADAPEGTVEVLEVLTRGAGRRRPAARAGRARRRRHVHRPAAGRWESRPRTARRCWRRSRATTSSSSSSALPSWTSTPSGGRRWSRCRSCAAAPT